MPDDATSKTANSPENIPDAVVAHGGIMMTRIARLGAGVLLPAPIGFFLFLLMVAPPTRIRLGGVLVFFLMLPVPYILVGLQSVVYTLLMEFCVWRIVGTNVGGIVVSGSLGALCGLSFFKGKFQDLLPSFVCAGFVTGLVTGLVLWHMRRAAERRRSVLRIA